MKPHPQTFPHIGLSVTNLEQAVEFYTETFGWYVIMPPTDIVFDDSAIGIRSPASSSSSWASQIP